MLQTIAHVLQDKQQFAQQIRFQHHLDVYAEIIRSFLTQNKIPISQMFQMVKFALKSAPSYIISIKMEFVLVSLYFV
mgnify:CR=1 FL=1